MLTRKQHEAASLHRPPPEETGFSPSFEEMKEALQLKSKSGIHRLISALEERGFLRRRHHRARALEVVRLPDDMQARTVQVEAGAERAAAAIRAERDPRRFFAALARRAYCQRRGRRADAAVWAHRRRSADRGDARSRHHHRYPHGAARQWRALRSGSRRRFDGRGWYFRRRHGDRAEEKLRKPGRLSSPWSMRRKSR